MFLEIDSIITNTFKKKTIIVTYKKTEKERLYTVRILSGAAARTGR